MDEGSGWVAVARSRQRAACEERAFVLRALGVKHQLERDAGGWMLIVRAPDAERALHELTAWEHENRGWPPPRDTPPPIPRGALPSAGVYALLLIVVFMLERGRAFGLDWWGPGKLVAVLVLDGEWWRTVTALTLHTDIPHLVGNLVFGAAFGVLLAQMLGSGVAWAAVLTSGFLGNALNAWVRAPEHQAVGASTAVFGALGCLAAYEWRRRGVMQLKPMRRWTPPMMGLFLLGWLGVGGERTDFLAHVMGMLAGGVLGVLLGSPPLSQPQRPTVQLAAGAAAILLVAGAWAVALGAG